MIRHELIDPYGRYGGMKKGVKPVVVTERDEPLQLFPHYSDPAFQHQQTVFGFASSGLSYDYSDRLEQWWGRDKMLEARDNANRLGMVRHSADWLTSVVSYLYGESRIVLHVVSGVNSANGYPYFVVGHMRPAI